MTVLRASSLAAVTILVWSTRLKPSSTAQLRTACRTLTMSSEVWTGSFSVRASAIQSLARRRGAVDPRDLQHLHGAFDVQRGPHAAERHAQLDQGDGDGRSHAHHHRLGVEHPRHRGDVAEHAADEGVDD